jgi:putative peptidoglycan lipid II flippase
MLRSSMVVGFFSLLGSLTGILVDTSIAAKLGLSKSSDTFYVAFTVPYVITSLISATGQFSLVPFFSTLDARHSAQELWRGFSYAINVVFLGSSAIAVAGAALAPWVARGIAPGLTAPQISLASELAQWLFLVIIPAGLAETFRSFLFSQRRFAVAASANLFRNATVIVSILLTFDRYGIYSIVLGYLAGHLLQLAILGVQTLVSFPVRYSITLVGTGEAVRKLHGAGAAQLGGAAGWQALQIVERIIASFLPAGSLTALNYGLKIIATIAELLAGSVGTASLPVLSRAVARQAADEERQVFQHALEIGMLLVSPVMIFCLTLPCPIIRLVFQHGNFTAAATALMSTVFLYYSLSLLPFSFVRVLTFYLFGHQEAKAFLRLSALLYSLNVAFDLVYVGLLRVGAIGIPLGLLTSLVLTSGLAFKRDLAGFRRAFDKSLGLFGAKTFAAGGLTALAVAGLRLWVRSPLTTAQDFLFLVELCGAGSLVFFGTLAALGVVRVSNLARLGHLPEDS